MRFPSKFQGVRVCIMYAVRYIGMYLLYCAEGLHFSAFNLPLYWCANPRRGTYYFAPSEHMYCCYTRMWLLCKHMRIVHNHALSQSCFCWISVFIGSVWNWMQLWLKTWPLSNFWCFHSVQSSKASQAFALVSHHLNAVLRKSPKPLVSLFSCFVARRGRKRGNRQTHRPSTVTLAARACAPRISNTLAHWVYNTQYAWACLSCFLVARKPPSTQKGEGLISAWRARCVLLYVYMTLYIYILSV